MKEKKKLTKQISLGIDPMTGRRIRKRIYGDTKAELAKLEKQAVRENERRGNPSNITLEQYITKWQDAYISTQAQATQRTFRSTIRKCEPLYHKRMSDITRTELQQIINDNWEHPSMCRLLCFRLNNIWLSAMEDGIVEKNVAQRLKRPKRHKPVTRPLTNAEITGIEKADLTERERLLMDILFQFGLRPQEALALDMSSVDRKNKLLIINKALAHKEQEPYIKKTKTEETRSLPIPDDLLPRLKPASNSTYFFVDENGSLYTRWGVQKLREEIQDKINIAMGGTKSLRVTDLTFYTLRHHRATMLYYSKDAGLTMKAKAHYMGHSEEMFVNTYSHMIEELEDMELLRQMAEKCSISVPQHGTNLATDRHA